MSHILAFDDDAFAIFLTRSAEKPGHLFADLQQEDGSFSYDVAAAVLGRIRNVTAAKLEAIENSRSKSSKENSQTSTAISIMLKNVEFSKFGENSSFPTRQFADLKSGISYLVSLLENVDDENQDSNDETNKSFFGEDTSTVEFKDLLDILNEIRNLDPRYVKHLEAMKTKKAAADEKAQERVKKAEVVELDDHMLDFLKNGMGDLSMRVENENGKKDDEDVNEKTNDDDKKKKRRAKKKDNEKPIHEKYRDNFTGILVANEKSKKNDKEKEEEKNAKVKAKGKRRKNEDSDGSDFEGFVCPVTKMCFNTEKQLQAHFKKHPEYNLDAINAQKKINDENEESKNAKTVKVKQKRHGHRGF